MSFSTSFIVRASLMVYALKDYISVKEFYHVHVIFKNFVMDVLHLFIVAFKNVLFNREKKGIFLTRIWYALYSTIPPDIFVNNIATIAEAVFPSSRCCLKFLKSSFLFSILDTRLALKMFEPSIY